MAESAIKVRLARDLNEQMPVYPDAQQLEVSVDGRRVQVFTLPGVARPAGRGQGGGRGAAQARFASPRRCRAARPLLPVNLPRRRSRPGPSAGQAPEGQRLRGNAREERNRADQNWDVRVTVTAGAHDVVATFLNQTVALDETPRLPFLRPFPAGNNVPETRLGSSLRSVEISGPHGTGATGDSASRRRIFVCHTGASQGGAALESSVGNATSEDECSNTILRTLFDAPIAARSLTPTCSRSSRCTARDASRVALKSASSGRFAVSSSAPSSCIASRSIRRTRVPVARIRSAISSSRRVCPSSCGAAFPTTGCSTPPNATACGSLRS